MHNPRPHPLLALAGSAAALLLLALGPSTAPARPAIRQGFFNAYPNAVGSRLDSVPSKAGHCGVCHYDFNGGGPRNAYGEGIFNSGFALNKNVAMLRFVAC